MKLNPTKFSKTHVFHVKIFDSTEEPSNDEGKKIITHIRTFYTTVEHVAASNFSKFTICQILIFYTLYYL